MDLLLCRPSYDTHKENLLICVNNHRNGLDKKRMKTGSQRIENRDRLLGNSWAFSVIAFSLSHSNRRFFKSHRRAVFTMSNHPTSPSASLNRRMFAPRSSSVDQCNTSREVPPADAQMGRSLDDGSLENASIQNGYLSAFEDLGV